jgi:hypothetical protein
MLKDIMPIRHDARNHFSHLLQRRYFGLNFRDLSIGGTRNREKQGGRGNIVEAIYKQGNYTISSSFGSAITEGTNSVGSNGKTISFNIEQNIPQYNSFYYSIRPISGSYSDFWDTFWSNKVGGEPADQFALSGYTSKTFSKQINPDSIAEANAKFEVRYYLSVLDESNGIKPVASAYFTIVDDDSRASDGHAIGQLQFGTLTHYSGSVGGQVYALYEGLLGRSPDVLGLEYQADRLEHGVSVRDLAQQFLLSPEGQARAGALNSTAFVQQLYQSTLHRDGTTSELSFYASQLDNGTARVDIALNFVFSPEHLRSLQSVFDNGLFVPDAQASDVARLYYTMLARAPDAAGLQYWTDKLDHGGSLFDLASGFLSAPENQTKYGNMSNNSYVDALYVNALGRHAEDAGIQYWTDLMDHGVSRANLAVSLSSSAEAHVFHLREIEQGWHLA